MKLSKLQQSVIEQLGYDELDQECKDTLSNVSNNGADAGYGQFIYYNDTISFFDANRAEILTALTDFADELGESACDMAKNFPCLNGDFNHEVDQVLMNIDCDDDTTVKNALSWFALEHVAYQLNTD